MLEMVAQRERRVGIGGVGQEEVNDLNCFPAHEDID
jgi:hypothetical protein